MKKKPSKTRKSRTQNLVGIGAAPGIGLGSAYVLEKRELSFPQYWISNKEISVETTRFVSAVDQSRDELKKIKERLCKYGGRDQIYILDSYSVLLQDEMLVKNTLTSIKTERINAEWALHKTLEKIKSLFNNVGEEYFRERRSDVDYVGSRIFKHLLGDEEEVFKNIPPKSIVVAHDLSPADSAQLLKFQVNGFILELGGKTSHTAIVARALHLPAVVACPMVTEKIKNGDQLILDGTEGVVLVNPNEKETKKYDLARKHDADIERMLLKEIHLPAQTQDEFRIQLMANMELTEEIESLKIHGAEGVGLYRTEFLYLNKGLAPTEEEQFEVYKKVLKSVYPNSATIRTLDIGADKVPTDRKYEREINPALGLRAIRFCFKEKDLFRKQLKALLRASVYGKLRIMFPMISSLMELKQAKGLLEDVKREMKRKKQEYDPHVKVGIMMEVPAAVMIAEDLAREVDFFSIGTNDLIQYCLAVDRGNENVAYLYRPLHPAILRMIRRVVEVAHEQRIEVSVCGEMASEPLFVLILLAFGLNAMSMNAISIPRAKKIIRSVSFRDAKNLLDRVLLMNDESEIEALVHKEMERLIPKDFIDFSRI